MTTYTLAGILLNETPEETVESIGETRISFVVPDSVEGFSTRQVGADDEDGLPLLEPILDDYVTWLGDRRLDQIADADFELIDVGWNGGTNSGIFASIYENAARKAHVFHIAGDAIPDSAFASAAAANAFLGSISEAAPGPGFEPGDFIRFDALPGIESTENDSIPGTPGPDEVMAGAGDDTVEGAAGDDMLSGGAGNDRLIGGAGADTLDGGAGGRDKAVYEVTQFAVTIKFSGDDVLLSSRDPGDGMTYEDTLRNIELLEFSDGTVTVSSRRLGVETTGDDGDEDIPGGRGDDRLDGGGGADTIDAGDGDDVVIGGAGDDVLMGGDGSDRINGGDGADIVAGGASEDDLADTIYGGDGDDSIDGGYGNDQIFGMGGNDTIAGGFGADELQGQDGDDVITGSAFGDIVFGNAGNDFVNGGFGHDLINGGTGADKFFHVGGTADQMLGHGSDWVQDYNAAEGDVLVFGGTGTGADFQVNFAHTENKTTGERSGDDDVEEAFVIYKPTGQILWALVDGGGETSINLQIGAEVFDLLA